MRCTPTALLLAVALVASGSCLAQQTRTEVALDVEANGDARAAETAPEPRNQTRAEVAAAPEGGASAQPTRSAFGKVIAIMISSLQRQSRDGAQPTPPVHTSDAGTPLGIDVGEAFRASPPQGAVQPEYAVRPPALAGPD